MKSVLNWIKSNVITVASIIVAIASLAVIYVFGFSGGAAIQKEGSVWNKQLKKVNSFMHASVDVPSKDPEEPTQTISNVTINDDVTNKLKKIYGKINGRYKNLYDVVVERNQGTHQILVDGIFDEDYVNKNKHLPYNFRNFYRKAFDVMLDSFNSDSPFPQLNAGLPPSKNEVDAAIKNAQDNYMSSVSVTRGPNAQLTPDDQEKIVEAQRASVFEVLQNQALSVSVYADTNPNSPTYPFQVGNWAKLSDKPSAHQMFEGQLELWIQQDIVEAIALANEVYTIDENGNKVANENSSVLSSPVKNLISIEVVPGYIGLQTNGVITNRASSSGSRGGMGMGSSGGAAKKQDGSYSPPTELTGTAEEVSEILSVNYNFSPTGRGSNALYDVRQARLVAIVDYQQLPKLFDAISKVNFMTVLDCQISQIDEYEALTKNLMYGKADCVQIDMLIETIWLRDWTSKIMPDKTLQYVGLKEPDEPAEGMMGGEGMFDPMMMGGMNPF